LDAGATYALEGGVWCAAAALEWARGAGLAADPATLDPAAPPAAARGLYFVPALAGLGCPHWDRAARGAFFGLGLDTGAADLARAVLEGVAFRAAEVVDAFARVAPVAGAVAIDGGMAANPAFQGFLADVLERPVEVALQSELTAAGVASLAALGLGAALEPLRPSLRVEPRGGAARWRAAFAEARAAAAAVSRAALA
jgi:glycerol kinase